MKMLLTSTGLNNESMLVALREMLSRDIEDSKLVLIPTAALAESSEHTWLIKEINQVLSLGWREFHIVPLNGLPRPVVVERLRTADCIYAVGGSVYHLALSIMNNGYEEMLRELIRGKVYIGSSAGSMIFSKHLNRQSADIFDETNDLTMLGAESIESPYPLFDWYIKPHLHSEDFPERTDPWIEEKAGLADFPIYAIDDQTAVRVIDGEVSIVSEGSWKEFNFTQSGDKEA